MLKLVFSHGKCMSPARCIFRCATLCGASGTNPRTKSALTSTIPFFNGAFHERWRGNQGNHSLGRSYPKHMLSILSIYYPYVIHMLSICYPYIIHMLSICYPYIIHMLSICYPYVIHMLSIYYPNVIHMLSIYYPYVIHMLSICYPYIIHMLSICYPYIIHMLSICYSQCQNYRTEPGGQKYGKIPYLCPPPGSDSERSREI